jgi:hypothetical protein
MAAGRPGFAPDIGEALKGKPGHQGTVIICGVGFTALIRQEDGVEAHGFTWADLDGRGDAKYAVSVATSQSEAELVRLLENADPDSVAIKGVLDPQTVIGDSGEEYRRIIGEVLDLSAGKTPAPEG